MDGAGELRVNVIDLGLPKGDLLRGDGAALDTGGFVITGFDEDELVAFLRPIFGGINQGDVDADGANIGGGGAEDLRSTARDPIRGGAALAGGVGDDGLARGGAEEANLARELADARDSAAG